MTTKTPSALPKPATRPRQLTSAPLAGSESPKYRQVYEDLHAAIQIGQYRPGDKLPSESELGERYKTSRITIAKAVGELQIQGLVSRRPGSGTHVLPAARATGHIFGLLIPGLGRTEIFEPICQGIMQSPQARSHSLLWGHAINDEAQQEAQTEALCRHYIAQNVEGVFFAPLEFTPGMDAVNQRIVDSLDQAGIQIVLLDRCFAPQPMRSKYDLVGIDNRRAGFLITQHLRCAGAKRIAFVARPYSASTVQARIAGYREALVNTGHTKEDLARRGDPADPAFLDHIVSKMKPDAIVCANDLTAAKVMSGLMEKGIRIPHDIRIVGFDDVKYASLLPVPLTTQHQNCADIGALALATMLRRLDQPNLPTQDIFLQTHTVVRRSCGAHLHSER